MIEPKFHIAVLPGDGIGPEVMDPCLAVLEAVNAKLNDVVMTWRKLPAGAVHCREAKVALPAESLAAARDADAVLLGAMGMPNICYPDGTEIAPQLDLRVKLNLYAGVRPVKPIPGVPSVLADPRAESIDFVLVRESTEGLFASRGTGVVEDNQHARDTLVITRAVSERLFDFAFHLARQRKSKGAPGVVTCVDKANVFGSFAFFRKIFDERALRFKDIEARRAYVDAAALNMVGSPWQFDVLVTENMFGDILSDLGAALIGGMGMAPSADIGDDHAVFRPCHGSAPDIVGTGKANPTAMFLSAAMMLEWLAARHEVAALRNGSALIRAAVDNAFRDGSLRPGELGGTAGTMAITCRVLASIDALDADAPDDPG